MSGTPSAEVAVTNWTPSEERRHLGESLRRLLDVAVQTGASPAELQAAAEAIEEVTQSLSGSPARFDRSQQEDSFRTQMSLVGGRSHPVAPQLELEVDGDTGTGEVVLGQVFQGAPAWRTAASSRC